MNRSSLTEQELLDFAVWRPVQETPQLHCFEFQVNRCDLHSASLGDTHDLHILRFAERHEPTCRCVETFVREKHAKLLAQLIAIDLGRLHLMEKVEGSFLGRRPIHLGHAGRPSLLVIVNQKTQDLGTKRIHRDVLGIGQDDHGRSGPRNQRIERQEPADSAAVGQDSLAIDLSDIQSASIARGLPIRQRRGVAMTRNDSGCKMRPSIRARSHRARSGAEAHIPPAACSQPLASGSAGSSGPKANDV